MEGLRKEAQGMGTVTTEERLDRLEKMFERIYHEDQQISSLSEKLMDVLIKGWKADGDWRKFQNSKFYLLYLDIEGLKKGHHSHSDKKRKPSSYSYIYSNIIDDTELGVEDPATPQHFVPESATLFPSATPATDLDSSQHSQHNKD